MSGSWDYTARLWDVSTGGLIRTFGGHSYQITGVGFISDGKTAYFYVPGEKQVRKSPLKKIDDLKSPLRFLLGHTRLENELRGLSLAVDLNPHSAGNVMLRGVPRNMVDRVSQIVLEINPQNQIERMEIDVLDGAATQFTFSRVVENIVMPDGDFRFSAPPGVEVVEQL